jgi:hypothetical protein
VNERVSLELPISAYAAASLTPRDVALLPVLISVLFITSRLPSSDTSHGFGAHVLRSKSPIISFPACYVLILVIGASLLTDSGNSSYDKLLL